MKTEIQKILGSIALVLSANVQPLLADSLSLADGISLEEDRLRDEEEKEPWTNTDLLVAGLIGAGVLAAFSASYYYWHRAQKNPLPENHNLGGGQEPLHNQGDFPGEQGKEIQAAILASLSRSTDLSQSTDFTQDTQVEAQRSVASLVEQYYTGRDNLGEFTNLIEERIRNLSEEEVRSLIREFFAEFGAMFARPNNGLIENILTGALNERVVDFFTLLFREVLKRYPKFTMSEKKGHNDHIEVIFENLKRLSLYRVDQFKLKSIFIAYKPASARVEKHPLNLNNVLARQIESGDIASLRLYIRSLTPRAYPQFYRDLMGLNEEQMSSLVRSLDEQTLPVFWDVLKKAQKETEASDKAHVLARISWASRSLTPDQVKQSTLYFSFMECLTIDPAIAAQNLSPEALASLVETFMSNEFLERIKVNKNTFDAIQKHLRGIHSALKEILVKVDTNVSDFPEKLKALLKCPLKNLKAALALRMQFAISKRMISKAQVDAAFQRTNPDVAYFLPFD